MHLSMFPVNPGTIIKEKGKKRADLNNVWDEFSTENYTINTKATSQPQHCLVNLFFTRIQTSKTITILDAYKNEWISK
jgi:hypothetical protein